MFVHSTPGFVTADTFFFLIRSISIGALKQTALCTFKIKEDIFKLFFIFQSLLSCFCSTLVIILENVLTSFAIMLATFMISLVYSRGDNLVTFCTSVILLTFRVF